MTRVFLSYARGDDEPFVERLYQALRARGFDVWWDRVCMPSRDLSFHQEIREAIAARERMVLVVGPFAARSDYVRQEWQFALQEYKVVTPILRLSDDSLVPDELRLFHHEDFRDDARFDFHLDNLVRQLSEPPPPLGKLIAVPSLPPHFLARSERLNMLRDALRADLDRPVVVGGAAARVGVHGMGGIGKSVLAAALALDRKIREAFPDGIVWVGLGSLPVVAALQRRVHRDLGGDGAFESEHEGKAALKALLADKAVLLVLDDAWRRSDVEAFDVLGPRCRALITTRDSGLLTSLGGAHHVVDLLTDHESLGLLALAARVPRENLPSEAAAIVAECGRLPLAVALCGGMVRADRARQRTWGGVLEQLQHARIDRIAGEHAAEPQHQSVWKAIRASVEFLPSVEKRRFLELAVFPPDEATPEAAIATLWAHTGALDDWDTEGLLISLGERSLVQLVTPRSESETGQAQAPGRQTALHDLVYDYVQRAVPDLQALHGQLLAAYQTKCPEGWPNGPDDGYFFTHLRDHLAAAGRSGELLDLLLGSQWLESKAEHGHVFDLPLDFDAARRIDVDDPARRLNLNLLDEALRRDIHFIARHPGLLFQCLWNTGWWYDCPDAAFYYDPPPGGWPPEGPPWDRPASERLSDLLEARRTARQQSRPDTVWLRSLRSPDIPLGGAQRAVLRGHVHWVTSVAFDAAGRRIVSGSRDQTVRVWDADSGREIACLPGHESAVTSVAFDAVGRRIVSGSRDQTVRVWDADSGREIACLRGHENQVTSVAFDTAGRRIVSGSEDETTRVWDADSGREIACLRGHEWTVTSVAFDAAGRRIVSGSLDQTVRIWDADSGREIACLRGHEQWVTSVAFDAAGRRIVSGSWDDTVRVWDADSGREIACLQGHVHWVTSVAFDAADRLVSGSHDNTVRVWDADSGREIACLQGHDDGVTSVAFDAAGRRIVSGSHDNTVRVWDADSGRELACPQGHKWTVMRVAFDAAGRRIVSGSHDNTVRVWDADSGRELACLRGHEQAVMSVAFDAAGHRIVSGSCDKTVRIWDADSGRELACLRGHEKLVTSVAFDAAGRRIVSGSEDGTVRVWDADSGCELAYLQGHEKWVTSVAFDAAGRRIVSGSEDETVRVWDADNGRELACLPGHESAVTSVAFDAAGHRIVSGSRDQTVRVWDADSGVALEVLLGTGDVVAIAVGDAAYPWRALGLGLETVIQRASDGQAVAWFPAALERIATHRSGRLWAGVIDKRLYLVRLEGPAQA